jgi:hypothetical protein
MTEKMTFSQHRLASFLTCQRRYQLRYRDQIPWPKIPISEQEQAALERGRRFHQLLERHFLGLPITPQRLADATLRQWWTRFLECSLDVPRGQRLPESSLTVSLSDQFLTGRFDLLILGDIEGQPCAHVFDWKTGRTQDEKELRKAWQTRLYLAILTEGGAALREDGRSLSADQVAITYWYVDDPDAPRTIRYDRSWHASNWTEIGTLIDQIAQKPREEKWTLTDDWSCCRPCAYQSLCGRQEAGPMSREMVDDDSLADVGFQMEPDLP